MEQLQPIEHSDTSQKVTIEDARQWHQERLDWYESHDPEEWGIMGQSDYESLKKTINDEEFLKFFAGVLEMGRRAARRANADPE